MDLLLHMYSSNFFDPLAQEDEVAFSRISTLYAECNTLLSILSATSEGIDLIRGHPFHILWANRPELPFSPPMIDRASQRLDIWKRLGPELVMWRMRSIMDMLFDWRRPYDVDLLIDIVVDVLEFAG